MPAPFDYVPSEPASSTAPSQSQPVMQVNAASISDLIAIDHVGFNNAAGGLHQQVTFNANNTPGSAPTGNSSIVFTKAGLANTAGPNVVQQNAFATFPMSCLRAFGSFSNLSTSYLNQFNGGTLSVVTPGAFTIYTVTLAPNCLTGLNSLPFVWIPLGLGGSLSSYSISGTTLTISYFKSSSVFTINFMVLQA